MAYYHNKGNFNKKKGNSQSKGDKKGVLVEDFYNPYAFVPLAEAPCFLTEDEAGKLMYSQDIPYSDGMSGHIDVHFKAVTPVCVKHNSKSPDSANIRGQYFIPGSSIKGMLRDVLEILSMSNIKNVMADDRYSMRDLGPGSVYSLKAEVDGEKAGGQRPGFLFIINNEYFIMPCDAAAKHVRYEDMDEDLSVCLRDNQSDIREKYSTAGNNGVTTLDGKPYMWLFSGYMSSKKHEYLLPIPDFSGEAIPLKGRALQDFIFIHEEENKNKSWKYWKRILERANYHSKDELISSVRKAIAPCFFRTKIDSDGESIRDLGFAYLYREPYKKSITDFLFEDYNSSRVDMASSIFGFTRNNSLKGRVQVQNAFVGKTNVDSTRHFILGSPKPSFFPFYIKQPDKHKLRTYSSEDAVIAGWKRYLVHDSAKPSDMKAASKKYENVASKFSPLKTGTEFVVRINYHNLRPFEIGALLAAISFDGHNECFHSLGYAKSMGYGKLAVTKVDTGIDAEIFMEEFRKKVCELSGLSIPEWKYYIKPLIDIAEGNYRKEKIRYPFLSKDDKGNPCKEFVLIKEKNRSIADFSPIDE